MADHEAVQALGHSFQRHVTDELWDREVSEASDNAHTTTLIARFITETNPDNEYDEALFSSFQEAFQGWTSELFNKAEKRARVVLKDLLRERGVFLPIQTPTQTTLAAGLNHLSTRPDFPVWPDDEILKAKSLKQGSRLWERRQHLLRTQGQPTGIHTNQDNTDNSGRIQETIEVQQTVENDNETCCGLRQGHQRAPEALGTATGE